MGIRANATKISDMPAPNQEILRQSGGRLTTSVSAQTKQKTLNTSSAATIAASILLEPTRVKIKINARLITKRNSGNNRQLSAFFVNLFNPNKNAVSASRFAARKYVVITVVPDQQYRFGNVR